MINAKYIFVRTFQSWDQCGFYSNLLVLGWMRILFEPFSLGIDVEDMSLAGKYRLFTHSIRLDCHLGSPFAAHRYKVKKMKQMERGGVDK